MFSKLRTATIAVLLCLVATFSSAQLFRGSKQNIVQLAEATSDLSTLVSALAAGRLVTALEGKGPFTVFAPTNEAFAKLPPATLQKLLKNTPALDKILEYHVVSGNYPASSIVARPDHALKTLEGQDLHFAVSGSSVTINGQSRVIDANIMASNGVVHIIDTVLIPPALWIEMALQ